MLQWGEVTLSLQLSVQVNGWEFLGVPTLFFYWTLTPRGRL